VWRVYGRDSWSLGLWFCASGGKICAVRMPVKTRFRYLAVALGMQVAVIEYAAVCWLGPDATSRVRQGPSEHPVVG